MGNSEDKTAYEEVTDFLNEEGVRSAAVGGAIGGGIAGVVAGIIIGLFLCCCMRFAAGN